MSFLVLVSFHIFSFNLDIVIVITLQPMLMQMA